MLRQLINGQTIKIDNHNCGKEVIWDRSIHFHKRMNSKKYRGAEVIIPIAEDGELEFRKIEGDEKNKGILLMKFLKHLEIKLLETIL